MKDLVMVLGMNNMVYDYTGYSLSILGPAYGNSTNDSSSSNGSKNNGTTNNKGPSKNMVHHNTSPSNLFYGHSLGSGPPSSYLSAKSTINVASVSRFILHSPFLSLYKFVTNLNGHAQNVMCPLCSGVLLVRVMVVVGNFRCIFFIWRVGLG